MNVLQALHFKIRTIILKMQIIYLINNLLRQSGRGCDPHSSERLVRMTGKSLENVREQFNIEIKTARTIVVTAGPDVDKRRLLITCEPNGAPRIMKFPASSPRPSGLTSAWSAR